MQAGYRIRPIFCHNHGPVVFFIPFLHFTCHLLFYHFRMSVIRIPSEIPVQADHIQPLADFVRRGPHGMNHRHRPGIIKAAHGINYLFKIGHGPVLTGISFVGHTPHDNAGMVFITGIHVLKGIQMMLQSLFIDPGSVKNLLLLPETHAHSRRLVNDYKTFSVRHHHQFLGIGIVGCTERICPHPFKQVKILHIQGQIHASSMNLTVLMLSKAFKIKGLPVNQEFLIRHFYASDTEGFRVRVFIPFYTQAIQICFARIPKLRVFNSQSDCLRHIGAFRSRQSVFIKDLDFFNFIRSGNPAYNFGPRHFLVQACRNHDILNVPLGGRIQLYWPVYTRIVIKIKKSILVMIPFRISLSFFCHDFSAGKAGPVQDIAQCNCKAEFFFFGCFHNFGNLCFKR